MTVVGTEIVTLEAAVEMIVDISDCVELCLGEKNRVLAVMEQKITNKAGSRREHREMVIGQIRHDTSTRMMRVRLLVVNLTRSYCVLGHV